MVKQAVLTIHGRVQGVFYRDSARRRAKRLGITGYARNNTDGTVSIVAEGGEENLKNFIEWCYNGPILAKVTKINVEWRQASGKFDNFNILY